MHHTEPHPLLEEAAVPSLSTLKARALHQLGTDVNVIIELIALVKGLTGILDPEKWAEQYDKNRWVYLINHREYSAARAFLLAHHA